MLFVRQINSYAYNTTPTEAIVVLTGGRNRIDEGIYLLKSGIGQRLFISGVSKKTTMFDIENKTHIKNFNRSRVELGYDAENTIGNAAEIKQWVEKNKISSLRLVTSNYHMPRAMEEIAVHNLNTRVIPHPVYSEKVARQWWKSSGTFKLLAEEYNKFLYTYLNHRIKYIGD